MKTNIYRLLALILLPAGFLAFQPVLHKSTVAQVELLLACGVATLTFCILFFPMIVKFSIFKKLDWTSAWSDRQRIAIDKANFNEFSLNSEGYIHRLKPYVVRIILLLITVFLFEIIFFSKSTTEVNVQAYLHISILCLAFYLIGVLCVICLNMFLALPKSKKNL